MRKYLKYIALVIIIAFAVVYVKVSVKGYNTVIDSEVNKIDSKYKVYLTDTKEPKKEDLEKAIAKDIDSDIKKVYNPFYRFSYSNTWYDGRGITLNIGIAPRNKVVAKLIGLKNKDLHKYIAR